MTYNVSSGTSNHTRLLLRLGDSTGKFVPEKTFWGILYTGTLARAVDSSVDRAGSDRRRAAATAPHDAASGDPSVELTTGKYDKRQQETEPAATK